MNNPGVVLIGLDVSSSHQENLDSIRKLDFLRESDIHLVHVAKEYLTGYDIMSNSQIVIEEDKEIIKQAVISRLNEIGKEILPFNYSGKVSYHCIFGFDPKRTIVNVAADLGAQLMVLAHRKEQPLFDESMSYFCGINSPCDVLIIRGGIHEKFKGHLKVACAVKVDESSLKNFSLKKYPFLGKSIIHMVHISPSSHYSFFPGIVNKFPSAERQLVVKEAVLNRLEKLFPQVVPENFSGEYHVDCIFSNNTKKSFCEISNEFDTDLMIIPQRQKAFGSFLHFQVNHSDKNILVLRETI